MGPMWSVGASMTAARFRKKPVEAEIFAATYDSVWD